MSETEETSDVAQDIQSLINSIVELERTGFRTLLHGQGERVKFFLDLSARAQDLQLAFTDLLKSEVASRRKLLELFLSSGALQDLHRKLKEFDNPDAAKIGDDADKMLDRSFLQELHIVADLKRRLNSRDEYLQETITETSRRCHYLEQTIAELELENQDLRNDYLTLKALTKDASFKPGSRAQKVEAINASKELAEEQEVSRWILELTNNEATKNDQEQTERDAEDHQDLIKLTQTLTTVADENELLAQDLILIRL